MARFRNYFLTGLVVAGPIAITFYLTWWFVNWVDGIVRPFIPIAYRPETYLPFGLPGAGPDRRRHCPDAARLPHRQFDRTNPGRSRRTVVGRIPAVQTIYRGLKQVFETLFSGNGSTSVASAWSNFPHRGCGRSS